MSGVLLASKLLKNLDQYKKLNFIKNVASRYLRCVYFKLIDYKCRNPPANIILILS